jgi:esterase/lipase superfamily enzyme
MKSNSLMIGLLWTMCVCVFSFGPAQSQTGTTNSVRVFYVGDRKPTFVRSPIASTQVAQGPFIEFAIANVEAGGHAPKIHIEPDEIWDIEIAKGTANPVDFTPAKFNREFSEALKGNEYAVFVHGCCVSREDTICDAAALSLALNCPVVAFDWATPDWSNSPPIPEKNAYRKSERVTELSRLNFNHLMDLLLNTYPETYVTVIGHSMGNNLVHDFVLQQHDARRTIDEIHLVRPDSSMAAFFQQESDFCSRVGKTYIYISQNDRALQISEALSSGMPRLGKPGKLISLFTEQSSADCPRNLAILDISDLQLTRRLPFTPKIHHDVPFPLIGIVHRTGLYGNKNDLVFEPLPTNPHFVRVRNSKQQGSP